MRQLLSLTFSRRHRSVSRLLGYLMAFNAGAINAGGFLVVNYYTSHMSGFLSMVADHMILGNTVLVLAALGALLAFLCGAMVAATQMGWAQQTRLRSVYACPLIVVAALQLIFGLLGAMTLEWRTPFAVPLTVLLLSFLMGMQNATLSSMSNGSIRTTHMTGVITDLGLELGKMLYWNRMGPSDPRYVHADWPKLRLYIGLLLTFFMGGLLGAWGFSRLGFICVVPLALLLASVSLPPLWADWRKGRLRWYAVLHWPR